MPGTCIMCPRPVHAWGYCNMHYRRWLRYGDPDGHRGLMALAHRFWSKVEKTDGCWNWTAAIHSKGKKGRPVMGVGGRAGGMRLASHVAWYLEYGRWPVQLNHTCDNPLCVRHDHLYEGTQAENMRDMAERGTCPAGHPRTPEHLQVRPDGTRYCKTCQNAKRRARRSQREGIA